MKIFSFIFSWALAALIGAGSMLAAFEAAAAPHTYEKCAELALSDADCHREIITDGGTPLPASDAVRAFTPRDFEGKSKYDRWYTRYLQYCKERYSTPLPRSRAMLSYPRFPVAIPDLFR